GAGPGVTTIQRLHGAHLSALVLPSRGRALPGVLRRADLRVVLLQPYAVDPFRLGVHRSGELSPVLRRTAADRIAQQHARLRGADQRCEGRTRHGARTAADLADPRPRPPALAGLL